MSLPTDIVIVPAKIPRDFPRLVEIWRDSVLATHDFLSPADREEIESKLVSDYFPNVHLTLAVSGPSDREPGRKILGFAGTSEGNLEMLFLDPAARGQGIGTALLLEAIKERNVHRVDVNEQNPAALGFYLHHGFTVVRRSATDDAGRPYPILHLELEPSH